MPLSHAELVELLEIHDLHTASIDTLGDRARRQHHPDSAARKVEFEERFVAQLDERDRTEHWELPELATDAMYAIAGLDLLPDVYDWLVERATYDQLVEFLSFEGGPDADFDDLVATCQIGLSGEPKLELARNYWDEMGHGALDKVHTELYRRLADALDIGDVGRGAQPVEALERSALNTLLATNRYLQPELVGALGLTELQAGPRCEKVLAAFERLDVPGAAWPFYEVHAEVDPIHGKAWVENVVGPLSEDPRWAAGILRGARWRAILNRRFFAAMADRFITGARERRAS